MIAATDSATIQLTSPLPSGATLFFIGFALDDLGNVILSPPTAATQVPAWLALVSPNAPSGAILEDRTPTFTWSSAMVATPPGPWTYEFRIVASAGGPPLVTAQTSDTVVAPVAPLEFNTSYRWAVTARLQDMSSVTASSRSSFVILDPATPRTTLLYQTFPNPFPSPVSDLACIWFDLAEQSTVSLDILDIRTTPVRHLYPPLTGNPPIFPPGRYGRAASGESGCTQEFTWDGRDDRGTLVSPGVYILRLRAGGRVFFRRMVFEGR
jgi:hypothetical protein